MGRRGADGGPIPHRSTRVLTGSVGSTLLAQMPAFMLGGLAVFVRDDLAFDRSGIGVAASVFFLASMLGSMPGGRLAQRLGPVRGVQFGAVLSVCALVGLATLASSWTHLVLALAVGGIANSIAQPASNLALARGIERRRQGLAFGVKQSAVPLSSILAGLAVPLVALTVGWRWAFIGGAVFAGLLVTLLPRSLGDPMPLTARSPLRVKRGEFRRFAIAGGLGTASTTAVGTFLVEALVAREVSVALAGIVLAIGNFGAVGVRIGLGALVDRGVALRAHVRLVAAVLATAAVGLVVMAYPPVSALLVTGALIACVGVSGWQGLFHFAVVRRSEVPAAATGVTQAGMFAGGVIGPTVFGVVASHSFMLAWTLLAVSSTAAALLLVSDSTRVREAEQREGSPP